MIEQFFECACATGKGKSGRVGFYCQFGLAIGQRCNGTRSEIRCRCLPVKHRHFTRRCWWMAGVPSFHEPVTEWCYCMDCYYPRGDRNFRSTPFCNSAWLRRIERDLKFVFTDKALIRSRSGWPDIEIGLSEIKALYRLPRGLIVESVEPRRRIGIPDRTDGFPSLVAELAKYGPIIHPPAQRFRMRFIVLIAFLLCWGLVLWSNHLAVVLGAAAIALTLLVIESNDLARRRHHTSKDYMVWLYMTMGWVAAAIVIYLRIARTMR